MNIAIIQVHAEFHIQTPYLIGHMMKSNLKSCVDCGKSLSTTAQSCNECSSSDPFGTQRHNDKVHRIFVSTLAVLALVVGGMWYAGIVNPLEWLALI